LSSKIEFDAEADARRDRSFPRDPGAGSGPGRLSKSILPTSGIRSALEGRGRAQFGAVPIFPEISMPLSFFAAHSRTFSAASLALALGLVGCAGHNDPTYGTGPTATPPSGGTVTIGGASNAGAAGSASGGTAGNAGGSAGASGSAGAAGTAPNSYPTTCEDLGTEPVIPPACATLMAPKSAPAGVLTDETTLDTQQIQAAITACPAGMAVQLAASGDNNAFLSGPLTLKAGVVLWIDTGVTLFASRNPRDFDAKAGSGLCGLGTGGASNCSALINMIGQTGTGVMGEGTIDGRGGEPVIGQTPPLTWWQMNDDNHFMGNLVAPRLIQTTGGKDFTLYKVHFQNSPKFHIVIATSGFVVWGITVNTDPGSPNTDGVDPSGASNGVIAYNTISTGDDNIAIKGAGPAIDNIIVAHNHFLRGHGMSIGSETNGGVKNVKVCDLSLDGTGNGLRIKSDASRGGLVQNVTYTDVCMRGVKDPFVFDAFYSSATGTLIPSYQNISLHNVHVLSGVNATPTSTSTFRGFDATHISTISLDNVIMDDANGAAFKAQDTAFTYGPGPANFTPTGTGITVTKNITGTDAPKDCSAAWTAP
jgi:polygalacturonase